MIDITKEHLLPIQKVPAYLESRGLGKRPHPSVVYRWISKGTGGNRLEAVRIGRQLVTSAEALQRWVVANAEAREARRAEDEAAVARVRRVIGSRHRVRPRRSTAVEEQQRQANKRLEDMRLVPTELDGSIECLEVGEKSTRKHVADALFRAGLRSVSDLRRRSLEDLLRLPGIGAKSEEVVRQCSE